jgi:hypothetical protein
VLVAAEAGLLEVDVSAEPAQHREADRPVVVELVEYVMLNAEQFYSDPVQVRCGGGTPSPRSVRALSRRRS